MSWVTFNGIDFDPYIAHENMRRDEPQLLGAHRRTPNGSMREDVSGEKERWSAKTIPLTEEIAEAVRGIFSGGDSISWNADKWTERGVLGSGGTSSVSATQSKFGGFALNVTVSSLAYDLPALYGPRWTVFGWQYGVAWAHWLERSDWGRYLAGVATTYAPGWVVVDGVLSFTSAPGWFDDVVVVPFLVPATWVPQIYTAHSAASLAPWHRVRAAGDFFGGVTKTIRGEVSTSRKLRSGASILEVLEIRMEEA